MTGKVLDNGVPGALILLVPIALAMVILVTAWPIVLGLLVFGLGVRFWQNYQWKKWCRQVDPFFHQLIRENRGCITAMDLSMKANLTGRAAKKFLDKKAEDYGAQRKDEENTVYYFLTASALGSIFDDSEPLDDEELETPTQLASASAAVETPPADGGETVNDSESATAASQDSGLGQSSPPESSLQASTPPEPSEETEPEADLESHEDTLAESVETADTQTAEPIEESAETVTTSADNHANHGENGKGFSNDELEHEASSVEDEPSSAPTSADSEFSLIQAELAKRLDMHSSTIGKRKSDPDFAEWSQSRDPQGIAWTYVPETKMFVPLE